MGLFSFSSARQQQIFAASELPFIAGVSAALPINTTTLSKKRQDKKKKN